MAKIRVLVVDDAVVVRRLVSDGLAQDPDLEVVGVAANGQIALAKIEQLNPDVVTLDLEMPVMDGLQTLAAIRKTRPRLPVIMFSALTERGAGATLDALTLGASDYVTKPANAGVVGVAMLQVRDELIPKIKALGQRGQAGQGATPKHFGHDRAGIINSSPGLDPVTVGRVTPCAPPRAKDYQPCSDGFLAGRIEILAIGVSTGGPNALAELLPGLAKDFPVPVVIVQHMPPLFTRLLAERLAKVSGFPTREATTGAPLLPGEVWVAPGGFHLEVEKTPHGARLRTHDGPLENSCRPAVDVLFRSVAQAYGSRALGVILTGMGRDGLRGCECIRKAGGRVLAQNEASSVVWGMPGAVIQAGLADKVLPLHELALEINHRVNARSPSAVRKPNPPARSALTMAAKVS